MPVRPARTPLRLQLVALRVEWTRRESSVNTLSLAQVTVPGQRIKGSPTRGPRKP
ncbi:hypothetical protein ACX8Z9_04865 [Arthrobacter halodurans]|uniref:Uncharacterized protein n=1 Tax=Arthrobacter halodurans TaxID=516699 RepID=A0ABV4UQ00_9MICC